MPTRLHVLALALLLSACATHEDGGKPAGVPVKSDVKPEVKPEVKPTPVPEVTVAVASVQLIQDCPDPETDAAATAATAAPAAAPVKAGSQAAPVPGAAMQERMAPGAAGKMRPGSTWTQPCTQSTLQLALRNPGKVAATLRVEAVRLVDVGTKRVLGPIAVRKPSVWSEQGTYKPWDEQVAVGAELKIGYRLAEPDWAKVAETLGAAVNLYAQPFVLEVDVSIDGVRQTVRSPEFVREQVHMIAT